MLVRAYMCGILALFSDAPLPDLGEWTEQGLARVKHRGPDGHGAVFGCEVQVSPQLPPGGGNWSLGHHRLAILDTSEAGRQPMRDHDGRCWITYNGEVYNHVELRAELSAAYPFSTHTDTEVILAAYRAWGEACLPRLAGMFAFVLVDLAQRSVLIARDRLGIKPLYIWEKNSLTAIVSEPKQLLALPAFKPVAQRQQVLDFVVDGVLGHEPELCCFDGVRPLPPGRSLTWKLGASPDPAQARSFWDPPLESAVMGWAEAVAKTRDIFETVVRQHLRSDVPVGSCLSGGVDSSSVVGVASRRCGLAMNTFSACSKDPRFDEQPYMDAVSRHCGTSPHKVFLEAEQAAAGLEELAYHQDEPFGSLSLFAQWSVMRAARQAGVPVLLDGQGGDETLCGYRKYAFFHLRQLLHERRLGKAAGHLLNLVCRGDARLFDFSQAQRYLPAWLRRRKPGLTELLRPGWRAQARRPWAEKSGALRRLREFQWADLRCWSLPVLLRYEDRNSMAFGVEARVPFVDHRFVEHGLTLPEDFFFRRGKTKRLLVEALGDALPLAVQDRRTKMGFETPQSEWLKGPLGELLEQRVRASQCLSEVLDTARLGDAFRAYRSGTEPVPQADLFRAASVALWLERFQVGF